ncbi:response regulator [Ramlibacter sp. 2FC]|uniref:response regulator n=1 Tax=Ramlibacter sp. 2FC TaxID=2502188 RepID=UPI0010F4904E|nr:response regulator [Ramlibacter sp. 2FC]
MRLDDNSTVEILVAEDSPTQAEQLRFLLEEHGYRVTVAPDGMDALARLRRQPFTLVISDVVMPRLDGYGLCQAIKGDDALKHLPVMLVTTLSDPADVIRGLACGADNFVRKPYDEKYLLSRIEHLLINLELRKNQAMQLALEIRLGGQTHVITAERQQMLDLLVSTYDQAVHVNDELKRRERDLANSNLMLQGLNRIAQGLNAVTTERAVVATTLDRTLELPGVHSGWIFLCKPEGGFRLAGLRRMAPAWDQPPAFAQPCSCQRRLLAGELDSAANVVGCECLVLATGAAHGRGSHASIPLRQGDGRVLGLLNLFALDQGLFGEEALAVLSSVGSQVALALARAMLHEHLEQAVAERTAKLTAEIAERERLQEAQARLTAIVEATPDLVATIGADGRLLYSNAAGLRLMGATAEKVYGASIRGTLPEWAARLVFEQGIPQAIAQGFWSGETALLRPDGTEVPVSQVVIAHKDAQGQVAFFSTIARDLTERQRSLHQLEQMTAELKDSNAALQDERAHLAERVAARTAELTEVNEALTRAKAVAEEASRAKSAFLAAMSHEIRTPMNGVLGMAEVLAESQMSDYQADLVKTIRESAQALLTIIDDILDFSKIEAGRMTLERIPLSLTDMVEGLCNSLAPVAERAGVDISPFIDPELPERVLSDDVRLRQVLYNLLGNAIKFSGGRPGQRGQVSLRVTVEQELPLRLSLRIADNGIGMAPETVARLFTPFTQGEVSTTRRFGGTGLGLAVCKRLVDVMQGEIRVESTLGAGTCFTIALPMERAEAQPRRGAPELAGLDCLVLDSPEFQAEDLMAYLVHAGARVQRVADLDAARSAAAGLAGPTVLILGGSKASPSWPPSGDGGDLRVLLVSRGRRRWPRVQDPHTVTMDGDVLRRRVLLRAVAVAAGRASPEVFQEASEPPRTTAMQAPTIAEARAQGRLVLVAEDDEINQKVILRQLALLGHAAEIADNGAEALRLWRQGGYALLLTDLHMPEMDGYMLTEAIRREEDPGRSRMPILALTANALRGEARRAQAVGMDDYLTKPVQLRVLGDMLDKWLPRSPGAVATDPKPLPGAAASPPGRAVDISVLQSLVGDDAATWREFLADYLSSARRLAADMRAALGAADAEQACAAAHKLKSSSRAVGALALGDLCAGLENTCRAGGAQAVAQDLAHVETAMAEVEADIARLLAES